MYASFYRRAEPALPANTEEIDTFGLYYRTQNIVIVYGNGRRLTADEHNHAGRILKTLDWLGREGIAIRGVFREDRCLCRSSVRALNLYLQHANGLAAFRRQHARFYPLDRFGWSDLQELLNLRWTF